MILSILIGINVSATIIPLFGFILFAFVALNLLANKLSIPTEKDKVLLLVGCLAVFMAIARHDKELLMNTGLLIFLPLMFYGFIRNDNSYFHKLIISFFIISTIFMLAENIWVFPSRFGLNFTPPTQEQYEAYGKMLNSTSTAIVEGDIKNRTYLGSSIRSGGYLSNPLVMPVLLSMAATFFYVLVRERFKLFYLVFSVIAIYLLLSSMSTTAIIAFLLTFSFYELYVKRKSTSIIITVIFAFIVVILINNNAAISLVYRRMLINLDDPLYFNAFFGFSFSNPREILSIFVGRWKWAPPVGVPSHVDLMSIIFVYGFIPAYLLYKRMLFPVRVLRKYPNNYLLRAYALVTLTSVICMFHAGMALTLNVMMLTTLLFLKSNQIIAGAINVSSKDKF